MPTKQELADAIARDVRAQAYKAQLVATDVEHINALAASLHSRFPGGSAAPVEPPLTTVSPPKATGDMLTARVALELVGHEAIVLENYLDSAKPPVWTWGIGVTSRSGHNIDGYKDRPQSIEHVLRVYLWLLRKVYIPDVLKAFAGMTLNEHQFAAALSFHYNTGAILKTDWVKLVKGGQNAAARKFLTTHYLNGGDLQSRRDDEAELFFDGRWSQSDKVSIVPVGKPSYQPQFSKLKRVDIRADMDKALAA